LLHGSKIVRSFGSVKARFGVGRRAPICVGVMKHVPNPEPLAMMAASKMGKVPSWRSAMRSAGVRDAADEVGPAPITILDGQGRIIQTVTAAEFRRIHGVPERPRFFEGRRGRPPVETSEPGPGPLESAA